MHAPAQSRRSYRFGQFEADLPSGELLRKGLHVRLQGQPFTLLIILLERAGEVVSREELRLKLWPADTYVEFDGSLNAALKRLRSALGDSAENPIFIETLPKRGYRFIAPVALEEVQLEAAAPAGIAAGQTQAEQVPAKTGEPVVTGTPDNLPRSGSSNVIYGAALLIVLLLGLGWYTFRDRSVRTAALTSNAAQPRPVRKAVAVLGFHNVSGRAEDQWLATAFSEMLSTELASGEKLRLVSGEDVANLRLSSPWAQTGTLSPDTTARVGTALTSDVLVLGSYTSVGSGERGQLRLDVTLQDARTGEILTEIARTSNQQELFRVTSEIGAILRGRLGVPGISDTDEAGVLASLPLDREAARFYALGLAKLRQFDATAAKDLLQQACDADPKFALGHAMLARAWGQLGYEQKHKEETKKALDLSVDLPRSERMLVEADYYESLADHEKAASTYRALFNLFPDSVEYGLQLVAAQGAGAHGTQALETIAVLRRLPPPASLDPRIDIAEARIGTKREASIALLHTAEAKASSQGRKMIYALARLHECMSYVYSDHPEQAGTSCEDAYNIYLAAGNRLLAADAIRLMGDQQGAEGHYDQAIATYERALKILRELGEHAKTGVLLNNMAVVFTNQGKLDRGEQLYRRAKLHFEQIGDKRNTSTALVNIADILYLRGNLPGAEKTYQEVLELEGSLENGEPGYALYRLADLELTEGRMHDAHRLAQQAVDSMRPKKFDEDSAISELGDILLAEGDLKGARQLYQEAQSIRQARGRTLGLAECQVSIAQLALEEGHPENAEPLLHLAIAEFEKEKADPDSTSAYTLLSRTLLTEGKTEEARKTIQQASELARKSLDPALTLPVAIQMARMGAAGGGPATGRLSPANARQQLHYAIASAKKLGYYQIECEARLALSTLDLGARPAGQSQLTELANEAHVHGLELISRKAADLAAGTTRVAAAAR